MKIPLLTLFLFLLLIPVLNLKAQQANGYVVLNYSPGTCKVQVEYWINNHTNGNGSMFIAVSDAAFQWDSTLFTVVKDSSVTAGLNLPDTLAPHRDIDSFSTRSVNGANFRTVDILRSTMYCDNMYEIPNQTTKPLAMVVLQFRNCSDASSYNFTDTTASNFIADVNDGNNNPSLSRKILIIVNKSTRPIDASGSKCTGIISAKNLNNVPIGDTSNTLFVPQAPLLVKKIRSFTVFNSSGHAELNWETNGDTGNKEFEIQKKTSTGFGTIGILSSDAFSSKTTEGRIYNFTDKNDLATGMNYYRIKSICFDGLVGYSEVKGVQNTKSLQVLVYPNPSNGKVNIILPDGNGTTDIDLIDFSGKVIKRWNGYKISNIELNGLQRGLYTLLIMKKESGEKVTQKITVQ
ncbi:MAG: T9SS type A sorting domain-containing protein [Sphingobacteriales bacterium]|nr:T9SS type A sorting domain-containing protein [Sphingobacteriales bacterium]